MTSKEENEAKVVDPKPMPWHDWAKDGDKFLDPKTGKWVTEEQILNKVNRKVGAKLRRADLKRKKWIKRTTDIKKSKW